ncbi:udp-glycosyltransferase 73c3 [Quercus suber]|uniref:Udp-glycosyltransferase 73c3 n=1 Tax=Quercus suber TaxID=58331 RepID=A0AAW0KF99_QUESU
MASTAQSNDPLHVFFFPFMSPGHLSPMIDIARLFASHGTKATILATPQKITRFQTILNRDQHTTNNNNIIDLLVLDFPYSEANLPENYENLDTLPSRNLSYNFTKAIMTL